MQEQGGDRWTDSEHKWGSFKKLRMSMLPTQAGYSELTRVRRILRDGKYEGLKAYVREWWFIW